MATDEVLVITTGGTIDKVYFDQRSSFEVGRTIIDNLLREAQVTRPYRLVELMQKDSLDLSDDDRKMIAQTARADAATRIVITHGTDTMTETAGFLEGITGKTIVMTGSLSPARFAMTDATFNVGMAFAAAQVLDEGVYIAMNGQVFPAAAVTKNLEKNQFEARQHR